MWKWAQEHKKTDYFAPPERGSIHSFGCAVDVSILRNGTPLDMGTGFDDLSELSGIEGESRLTPKQRNNRELLRDVMKHG
jgi:D-alanyl-D-alanine dipeptidase